MGALTLQSRDPLRGHPAGAACGRRTRRGSTLVAVLLLMTVLMVLGMALLSQKSSQYEAAVRARQGAQARAIAQAGLEDARIKMAKDAGFPPLNVWEDEGFSYSEDFADFNGQVIGSYTVTVGRTLLGPPHLILQLTSLGVVGPRDRPFASYRVYAEVDMSEQDRTNPSLPNPDYMRQVIYLEQVTPDESVLP